ncbi:M23 family metallopeptidase [Ulvibacter antarcticus]|uniref:Murein DD-endopeptidase MepM/ murein hydrolase activator NlpD n=1 Tax=Ulvibacter antarcticus TaxID=442714 RepID=A0A3L9YZ53_9FLAO|nr:M23 family metallopeptidase [Ulvibacter antarcticus]RMA66001.1 murein DD-endopeptidase MepM/ murein hydrolase activator NlpD [Ulvibacter antarcticus]
MAEKEKRSRKIRKKLLHKYRLVVLNEDTFEERFSFKLNRLNVFVFSTILAFFLIGFTTLLIAFTPLREYIPGYSSTALKKKATDLTFKTDSLQRLITINEQYVASIRKVLTGDVKMVDFNKDSIIEAAKRDTTIAILTASKQDSLLRDKVAQEDKYNPLTNVSEVNYRLFAPVKGMISEKYDPLKKHFGVDVVAVKDAPVKATSDGTVIFAEWTAETGYVIILEHKDNLLSVYKHNAVLNKQQGQQVKEGEVIAIVGNSGEHTTGPHLHFELWSNGYPINPTNFIDFD